MKFLVLFLLFLSITTHAEDMSCENLLLLPPSAQVISFSQAKAKKEAKTLGIPQKSFQQYDDTRTIAKFLAGTEWYKSKIEFHATLGQRKGSNVLRWPQSFEISTEFTNTEASIILAPVFPNQSAFGRFIKFFQRSRVVMGTSDNYQLRIQKPDDRVLIVEGINIPVEFQEEVFSGTENWKLIFIKNENGKLVELQMFQEVMYNGRILRNKVRFLTNDADQNYIPYLSPSDAS